MAAGAAAGAAAVSPEFMYGGGTPPKYGLTNDVPAQAQPPPNPYGQAGSSASRATLQGAAGVFTIVPGVEMKAGRDGSQCGILLTEPRVSGMHATLKLEGGQLLLRDEHSNNGSFINGNRLSPGAWTPVQNGSLVRFGPVEFSVRLE
jgi:pSer/pThr/pTyr-binding forkhead associated (FHA) protein